MEDKELFEITARSVIVEVTDEKTGEVFRRELPIDFYENANLLRLSGENLDGSKGFDHDPCGGHTNHSSDGNTNT